MVNNTFRQSLGFTLISVILFNFVAAPFVANRAFADVPPLPVVEALTPEQQAARLNAINKAQWDGALAIKSFTLPGLNNDASTGQDEDGMITDLSDYKDEDGNHDFSSFNMDQMFQGFTSATHDDYMQTLRDMSDEPNLLQDASATFQDNIDAYDNVVCDDLDTEAEQITCQLSKNAQIINEMRANEGRDEFLGSDDPILTSFAPFGDGTHPYFTELQSEECVEVTSPAGGGEGQGLLADRYCLVPTELADTRVCEVERYLASEFVAEKVIMSYVPRGGYSNFNHDFTDGLLMACEDSNLPEGTSCIEIRTLDSSAWDLESYVVGASNLFGGGNTLFRSFGITFAEDLEITNVTVTAHSILLPDLSPPLSLSEYDYVFDDGFTSPFVTGTAFAAKKYAAQNMPDDSLTPYPFGSNHGIFNFGRGECISDNWIDDRWLGVVEFEERGSYYRCYPPDEVNYASPIEPNTSSILNQYNNENGFFFAPSEHEEGSRYIFRKHTARIINFDGAETAISEITADLSGRLDNLTSTKFYFSSVVDDGDGAPPVNPDSFQNAIIDDEEDYPNFRLNTILGQEVILELDVFDQGTYSVNEYFPTNIRVEGDTVTSWELESIGRPTDRYQYRLNIEFDAIGDFEVIADLHRVVDEGFRPREGEDPSCQTTIDVFLANTVAMNATCDYQIEPGFSKTTQSGVLIDQAHIGYFQFMSEWGVNGNPPLNKNCYDATIEVDTGDIGNEDRSIMCSSFSGTEFDNCMAGYYCEEDIINGGQACFEMGDSLERSFTDSCANYLSDDTCIYQPSETRCEEYIDLDGTPQCMFESHKFECDEGGNGYSVPTDRETTEIVCGTPRECINGTCSSIEEESNDAFLRATALQNIAGEVKNNECAAGTFADDEEELASCTLFDGEVGRCRQAKVFGAPDCCDPADLGFGNIDIVAYWQATQLMNSTVEQMTGSGLMSHAWGVIKPTVPGQAIIDVGAEVGRQYGTLNKYLSDATTDAYNFVSGPLTTGWNSTMSTLGFSNSVDAGSLFSEAGNVADLVAANADKALESTLGQMQTLADEFTTQALGGVPAPTSGQVAQAVGSAVVAPPLPGAPQIPGGPVYSGNCPGGCAELFGDNGSAMTGMSKFIAQGVNDFLEDVAPDLAKELFATEVTTEVAQDGTATVTEEIAFNNTPMGNFAQGFFQAFSTVMLVYQIYSMYKLAVNLAFACDDTDFNTTQKTKLLQTTYIGSTCSKKLFIGGCVEFTQVLCVYNSVFTRIISEQIRLLNSIDEGVPLLNKYLIDPTGKAVTENATCDGFTLGELESLDWDRIDLSEYEQILLSKLKYNPNNMPEDFVKSDYLAGSRSGPQSGLTIKEDGIAQATVAGYGSDAARQNMTEHNMVLDDPDFMAWYVPPESGGQIGEQCLVRCDSADGFSYSGVTGLCERLSYTPYPATISCDADRGYIPYTNQSNEVSCRRTTVTPITIGCREDYILNTDTGFCEGDDINRESPTPTCPDGYRADNEANECVLLEVVPQVIGCTGHGEGYELIEGACVQTELAIAEPDIICPNDQYTLDGRECVLENVESKIITCPEGLVYDNETEACYEVSTNSAPPLLDCSVHGLGYTLVDDVCERVTVVPATISCDTDNGYTLDGNGDCQRTTLGEFEPISSCPAGYLPLPEDDTQCFQRILAPPLEVPYCADPTFTLVGDICEKITDESQPAQPKCPNGGIYDPVLEQCEIERSYPATIVCPDGTYYTEETSMCEGENNGTLPPTYSCENVTDELDEQTCISSEITGFSLECPNDYTLDIVTETCLLFDIERVLPIYSCPDGAVQVSGFCYEYLVDEVIWECPEPSLRNVDTGACEETITDIIEPISLCPFPSFKREDGTCATKEQSPAIVNCPEDIDSPWILNTDNFQCYRETLLVEPSITVCPDDEPECDNAIYREPVVSCDDGSANTDTGFCEDYLYAYPDPNRNCDTLLGFDYVSQLDMCVQVTEISAINCGPDFSFNTVSGSCEHIATLDALPDCAVGYSFDGSTCIRVDHSSISCEDITTTYNVLTGKCEGIATQAAVNECQSPYIVDLDNPPNCILPETYAPTCPLSDEATEYNTLTNRCEHIASAKQIEPIRNCSTGILVDGRCFTGNTTIPNCPSGSTYNSVSNECNRQLPTTSLYCLEGSLIDNGGDMVCRTTEQKHPECPSASYYDIPSNTCIERQETLGTMECPGSGVLLGVLSGTQCLNYQLIEYTVEDVCPDGFSEHSPTECIRQLPTSPPNFACPDGFIQLDDDGRTIFDSPMCFAEETFAPTCSGDYALVGNRCVKDNDIAPMESCIVNSERVFGIHCQLEQATAPICPAGTGLSSEHDVCVENSSVSAAMTCTADYSYNSVLDMCISVFDEVPECEIGYIYEPSNDICRQIQLAPECSIGTYDVEIDQCVLYETTPATTSCLPGQIDTGLGCANTVAPICPSGYVLDVDRDLCTVIQTQPYDLCASGQQLDGNICRNVDTPTCPLGSVIDPTNEDQCVDTVVIDDAPVCTGGYTYNLTLDACTQDSLLGDADRYCAIDEDPMTEGCQISNPISDTDIVCPSGEFYEPATQNCQEYVFGTASCPNGESYIAGQCQEIIAPTCTTYGGLPGNSLTNSTTGACQSYMFSGFEENINVVNSFVLLYESAGYSCSRSIEDTVPRTYGAECSYSQPFSETCPASGGTVTGPLQCSSVSGNIRDVCDDAGYDFISDNLCRGTDTTASPPTCTSLDENGSPFVFVGGVCNGSEEITVPPTGAYHCDNYVGDVYLNGVQCFEVDGDVSSQDPCLMSNGTLLNDRCQGSIDNYVPILCSDNSNFTYNSVLDTCLSNDGFPYSECSFPYSDNGSMCERELVATPDCPSGNSYDPSLDICVATTSGTYQFTCDIAGFTPSAEPSVCERYTYTPATCASGDLVDDVCVIQQFDVPTYDCGMFGTKYSLDGSLCQADVISQLTCPNGSVADVDVTLGFMQCHAYSSQIGTLICLDGYGLAGSTCSFEYTAAPVLECEDGYTINSATAQCESNDYDFAIHTCDEPASILDDDKACRSLTIVVNDPADIYCGSPGFELDEFGRCVLLVNGPVNEYCENASYTLVPIDFPVDGGPVYECHFVEVEYISPSYECDNPESVHVGGGICEVLLPVPPQLGCPAEFSFTVDETQCFRDRVEIREPVYSCADPFILNAFNECRLTNVTTATVSCEQPGDWTIRDGFCEQEIVVDEIPAIEVCNGVIDNDGDCIGFIEVPAMPSCPPQYIFNNISKLCEGSLPVVELPLSISCPIGPSPILDGTTCRYIETFPSNGLGCPGPGWVFDEVESECSIYLRETDSPILCAPQYEQRFRQCFSRDFIDAEYVCPDGTTQDPNTLVCTGTRIEFKPPLVICPSSYLTSGRDCILVEQEIPAISCSDPAFTVIGNYCYQDIISSPEPPVISCPEGYTEQVENCTFEFRLLGDTQCEDVEWQYNEVSLMCERDSTQVLRPISGCPEAPVGFVPSPGLTCSRTIATAPIVLACDEGILTNGLCEITLPVTHTPDYCVYPAEVANGQCEAYADREPIIVCAEVEGVVRSANGCAMTLTETQVPTTSCE